ncbi:MAG: hypothetical protein IPI87_13195 [Betaproteobacteria bacterium]|nr:hypothetical protein [Betaproteobacteria bacterium]
MARVARARLGAPDNGFAFHNFWHLALFHLDGADHAKALELYDRAVHPGPAQMLLTLVDATALLWRLVLDGADVGPRFGEVADEWESKLDGEGGNYAFNDLHAALAFAATGRDAAMARLLQHVARAAESTGTNGAMEREVGMPLIRAIAAYGRGWFDEAADLIAPVRDIAHRFRATPSATSCRSRRSTPRGADGRVAREARAGRAPRREAGAVRGGAGSSRAHRCDVAGDALTRRRSSGGTSSAPPRGSGRVGAWRAGGRARRCPICHARPAPGESAGDYDSRDLSPQFPEPLLRILAEDGIGNRRDAGAPLPVRRRQVRLPRARAPRSPPARWLS